MTIIRPGQRVVHVPGLGVRTSSRAVASAGSGTDWSVWWTSFWDAKSAASQAASYLDLVGSNNLSVGSAPAWAAGTGWTFTNDWLDTGIAPASTGTLMIQYASASGTSRVLGGCFKLATNERFFIGVSSGGDYLWGYGDGSWTGASFAASANMAIAGNTGYVNGSSDSTASGAISRTRGNTWLIPATIGAITGYTSLWFTVKHSKDDADADAILQIKKNASETGDGLIYKNGSSDVTAGNGSITVSDASTGAIITALVAADTDDMPVGEFYYDYQALIGSTITTPDSGTFTVTADVTRSIT